MDRYRVLSLDGGGSWALIQVKALIALYGASTTGHRVLENFDLAAANSGGSIVLGCLIEDFTLDQILAFFNDQDQRETIFSKTSSIGYRMLHALLGIGPRYSAENKLHALQRTLKERGNLPLPDAVAGIGRQGAGIHVLMTAFDYDRNRSAFFRSGDVGHASWGYGAATTVTLAEAIDASTNAPVNYFDAPASFPDHNGRYWDGAIAGCNNPVLAAVTEAIGLWQDPSSIVALSLGTASVALPSPHAGEPESPYTRPPSKTGLRNDLIKLACSILDDPPDIATFLAHVMTGSGQGLNPSDADSRVVRMSPLISPVRKSLGGSSTWVAPGGMTEDQFKFLVGLDIDAVDQEEVDAIFQYADLWLSDSAMNQPVRMHGDTLKPEIGQDRFSVAKAAWEFLSA